MRNALVVMKLTEAHKERLRSIAPEVDFQFNSQPTDDELNRAEIVVGNAAPDRLARAPKLRFVQLQTAGVTRAYRELCAPGRNIALCNASGSYGLAISEHMFGMLLGLQKRLFSYHEQQRGGLWNDLGTVKSVYGAKVLVIGMGDIGGEFARRCHAFGAEVTGIRRSAAPCPDYCARVGQPKDIDFFLPTADIVFLCMPETPETIRLMNRERIFSMKKGAILLNAGRGTVLDNDALADALQSEHLFGAGLDVTDPEPLPADHPLWHCGNICITPHVSGGFHLEQTHDNIVDHACRNIRAYLDGAPLHHQVEYKRGY